MPEPRRASLRPLPNTLRGRLALAVLVADLVVIAVAGLTAATLGRYYSGAVSRERAHARMSEFDSFLAVQLETIDVQVLNYSEWDEFRDFTDAKNPPPAEWLENELTGWLPTRTDAETVVWADKAGRVIYSQGDPADVAMMVRLASELNGEAAHGTMAMSKGPAIVSVRPITGWPKKPYTGYMALGQYVSSDMLEAFRGLTGVRSASVGALEPAPRPADSKGRRGTEISTAEGVLTVRGALLGYDGEPVGTLTFSEADPSGRTTSRVMLATLLVAAVLSMLTGVFGSILLVRLVRSPVEELVAHVRDAGEAAAAGARYEPDPPSAALPAELLSALQVVDALVGALADHQVELTAALRQAQDAEAHLRIAIDDSPEAKLLVREGTVLLVNPAATALLSRPASEIVGRTLEQAFGSVRLCDESGADVNVPALLGGPDQSMTLSMAVPGKATRWMDVTVETHSATGSQLITGHDVTERRRIDHLRSELVSLITHDLRSPLAVIVGYLGILQKEAAADVREKALTGARANAERLDELLGDLLDVTKAEELFAPQTMSQVRLDALAEEVADSLGRTTRRRIDTRIDGPVLVRGEERRLRQVLVNLVTNAIKFSPENTSIEVGVRSEDTSAIVDVEDAGPGVGEEDRERIFERFFRSEETAGRPGSGLGLYVVKAITTSHGGSVRVETPEGGIGARFIVELPLAEPKHREETDG